MSIPDANGELHAVYSSPPPAHGASLNIIDPATGSPGGGQLEVTWSVRGPQGPQGPPGAGLTVASVEPGVNNLPRGGLSITDGQENVVYLANGPEGPQGQQGTPGVITAGPSGLDVIVVVGVAGSSSTAVAPPDHPYVLGGGYHVVQVGNAGPDVIYNGPQIIDSPIGSLGNGPEGPGVEWLVVSQGGSIVRAYAICSK